MGVGVRMEPIYMFRGEIEMEKERRQVFLRSYQFSRKVSVSDRIRRSLFRAKRVMWGRLRKTVVWFNFIRLRRRKLAFFHNCGGYYYSKGLLSTSQSSSNCFC
ncbi:uncharacterized protein LOC127254885 [Andrographis paniculata]|uniref:uncharacterized protein LOC127254885 n=1 Tax=Andrographis paniculata TaxID=175694 RepID=UPI0021E7A52C|nr:uncharacterized protein LOC127254885 [Andrographis paniculata]